MTIPGWPGPPTLPEIPYPYPPLRPMPRRSDPVAIPMVDLPSGDAVEQLRARRRVLVNGTLDTESVTAIAAELMALDGQSPDPVELLVNSDGGPIADIVALLDVLGSMRAPVTTVCLGRAYGTAAIAVASGTGARRAAPHARLSLRTRHDEQVSGTADEVAHQLDELAIARRHVVQMLALATTRSAGELADALDGGDLLDAPAAKAFGLIDTIDG